VRAGQHHAIASIYEYFLLERACLIVVDLLQGDELIVELCSRYGGFSERDVALSMRQVFSAVDYIHSLSIAHRDLKAENFHLRLPKELESTTLVDFGLAKAIQSSQKLTVPVGTPEYAGASSMCVSLTAPTFAQAFLVLLLSAAPEIILEKPYTTAVDAWSLGICLCVECNSDRDSHPLLA
jgi:serine/threonine protein kinase